MYRVNAFPSHLILTTKLWNEETEVPQMEELFLKVGSRVRIQADIFIIKFWPLTHGFVLLTYMWPFFPSLSFTRLSFLLNFSDASSLPTCWPLLYSLKTIFLPLIKWEIVITAYWCLTLLPGPHPMLPHQQLRLLFNSGLLIWHNQLLLSCSCQEMCHYFLRKYMSVWRGPDEWNSSQIVYKGLVFLIIIFSVWSLRMRLSILSAISYYVYYSRQHAKV